MKNLVIGLVLGAVIGAATSTLIAQRRPEPFPDAVTADPAHYRVAFENNVARFLRVKYGPNEKSVMHRHLPGCVIFLTDQAMNFTVPDGTTVPITLVIDHGPGAGDVRMCRVDIEAGSGLAAVLDAAKAASAPAGCVADFTATAVSGGEHVSALNGVGDTPGLGWPPRETE